MDPNTLTVIACALGFAALAIGALWNPVHRCGWKNACPHYRLDQQKLEREAQERADSNLRKE